MRARPLLTTAALAAVLLAPPPVTAQVPLDPGRVVAGKVVVKVYVTLSDELTPYHPLTGFQLRFFRGPTDSVAVLTDDAGVVLASFPPGEYRLVSGRPYEWRGVRYSWSMPIEVRPGMGVVELTPANARTTALTVATAGAGGSAAPLRQEVTTLSTPTPAGRGAAAGATARAPKDGTLGVVLSLLITGGGQFYAGKPGKGVGFLLAGLAGSGMVIASAANCDYYDDGCDTGLATAGLALALGAWVTSMVSAPGDVRDWNARQGFAVAGVRPLVEPGAGGTARLGFALPMPRR